MKAAFFILLIYGLPSIVFGAPNAASDYTPLIGVPGLTGENLTIETYIDALYVLTISIAAFLAVAKLVWAGVQYMITDLVPSKDKAKRDIFTALIGLLIVIGAVLILNTINPTLTKLGVLNDMKPVRVEVEVVPDETEELSMVERCSEAESCLIFACTPGPTACLAERERCRARLDGTPEFASDQSMPKIACFGIENEEEEESVIEDEVSLYQCTGLGRGQYDCSNATTRCINSGGEPGTPIQDGIIRSIPCTATDAS